MGLPRRPFTFFKAAGELKKHASNNPQVPSHLATFGLEPPPLARPVPLFTAIPQLTEKKSDAAALHPEVNQCAHCGAADGHRGITLNKCSLFNSDQGEVEGPKYAKPCSSRTAATDRGRPIHFLSLHPLAFLVAP